MAEYTANGMLIVERIDNLLKQKEKNRVVLAESIGIKPQNISAWSVRGTIPAGDICLKIAQYLDVSVEWLITGKETGYTNEERKFLSLFGRLEPSQQKTILAVIEQMAAENAALEKNKQNA